MNAVERKDKTKRNDPPALSKLIEDLTNKSTSKVYNALVCIRTKVIKEADGVSRLRQHGGLDHLLSVIKQTNKKILDIGLSILGNCCMEDQTRLKILKCNGLDILENILKNVEVVSIENRASRTVANLAMNSQCRTEIHDKEGLVELFVRLLRNCEETECLQTHVRTVRLLSVSSSEIATVIDLNGLEAVSKHLDSDDQAVVSAVLRTISVLLSGKIISFHIEQLVAAKAFHSLIKLLSDKSSSSYSAACTLMWKLINISDARPPFGNADGLTFLIRQIQACDEIKEVLPFVNALCLCCQEVVNRVKIRNENGLQLLIKLLRDEKYSPIHDRIISALVCCLYDEEGLDILLKSSLVPVLLSHLIRVAKLDNDDESYKEISKKIGKKQSTDNKTPDMINSAILSESCSAVNIDEFMLDPAPKKVIQSHETNVVDDTATANKQDISTCTIKYSIDSPTYKEIAESRINEFEIDDDKTGCVHLCQPDSPILQPCSPASYHSPKYGDPYSPLSIASSYISPNMSPEFSPVHDMTSYSPLNFPVSPANSDLQSNNSLYSPVHLGLSGLPGGDVWKNTETVHYSSTEEDSESEDLKIDKKQDRSEIEKPLICTDMICDSDMALKSDPIFSDVLSHSEFIDLSPVEPTLNNDNKSDKAPKRRLLPQRRDKPRLSLEKREKVQKAIEKSVSTSSLNLEHLLNESGKKETKKNKKYDHLQASERNILILFSRISHMENASEFIVNPDFFISMSKYLIFGENFLEHCSRIIHRILRNPFHFTAMILHSIPSVVHEYLIKRYHLDLFEEDKKETRKVLNDTEDVGLSLMSVMCLEAESAYGRGDITHMLLTGPIERRQMCAVALPFIIRSNSLLHKMLFQTDGWLHLVNACRSSGAGCTRAMLSVSHLANRLNLEACVKEKPDKESEGDQKDLSAEEISTQSPSSHNAKKAKLSKARHSSIHCQSSMGPAETNKSKGVTRNDDIEFILENNACISISKSMLVDESEVFCAMLHGHYIESIQSTITLPNVPFKAFKYCVDLLDKRDCEKYENDLSVMLEALVLVDQYMLIGCSGHVMEVLSKLVTSENIYQILQVAQRHNAKPLVKYCILHALTGDLKLMDRLFCTDILFNVIENVQIVDILRETISERLHKSDME